MPSCKHFLIALCLFVSLPSFGNDDRYTYYALSDMLDVSDYFREYQEFAIENEKDISNEMFEYDRLLRSGYGRRMPTFSRILLRTDEGGDLKQYVVYLSLLANKDTFNCNKLIETYNTEFIPLKPEFYINSCSKSVLNFYRSHNYTSNY